MMAHILRHILSAAQTKISFLLMIIAAVVCINGYGRSGVSMQVFSDTPRHNKGGFPSLFSASSFDPAKPYVAQLNPKAISFVDEYVKTWGNQLRKMQLWAKPYFDMYDDILAQHHLPIELKYLSVIESSLKAGAVSVAGAVGPWQIMPYEAQRKGLHVNAMVDERTSYFKSTHAAASILKDLYKQFNDWILVIAAYNCGAGRVRQAMNRSHSSDFWDLQAYLPLETRNHVKKFIATHYIFEGSGGLTTMTARETTASATQPKAVPQMEDYGSIPISGRYNASIIARVVEVDLKLFQQFNPGMEKVLSSGKEYNLRLPHNKLPVFIAQKQTILDLSLGELLK